MRSYGDLALAMVTALLLAAAADAETPLRLATTTSTENSGLLQFILPHAQRELGFEIHVVAVGSGKALKLGENGDVDVLISHAPELEEKFVAGGWGIDRRPLMYNDFVVVGPLADPAGVKNAANAADVFARIDQARKTFISRGDESGTHVKEKALWQAADVTPQGDWYVSAGLGQGATLLMASEKEAYTLTDRGTYLTFKQRAGMPILYEGDPALVNPYSTMAVSPKRHPHVQYERAKRLIEWLTGTRGQELIGGFKVDGQVLFHPGAPPG